jgi:putative transposase
MAFRENTRIPRREQQAAPVPHAPGADVVGRNDLPSVAAPDAVRAMVATLVQETIRAEFDRFVGAQPYERTPARQGHRNGRYQRQFRTRVGAIVLDIPRDRAGLFRPSLFAKYERSEQALVLAMIEMYVHGVSTRKVSAVVETLCGTTISASEVSALTRKLDATLSVWRERSLADTVYPALIIDAHYERVRREGHVRSTAALWVVGVTATGYREHLGVWMGASESEASWASVFKDLIERGLRGVTYVVSDEHVGLGSALARYFPEAIHQRCQVHYQRNALSKLSSEHAQLVMRQGLRDAWQAPSREEAALRIDRLATELTPLNPRAADWLRDTAAATLACYVLDRDDVRHVLRSTNSLERHHREVRRRTHVVHIFPHEASVLRLLTALAVEQNDRWSRIRWLVRPTFIPTPMRHQRSA